MKVKRLFEIEYEDEMISPLVIESHLSFLLGQRDIKVREVKEVDKMHEEVKEPEPLDTIEYPTEVMCFKVEDVLKEEDDGIDEISLNLNFESFSNREDLDKFLRKLIPDPRLEGRLPVLGDMFLLTGATIDDPEQKKLLGILNKVVDKMHEEVKE